MDIHLAIKLGHRTCVNSATLATARSDPAGVKESLVSASANNNESRVEAAVAKAAEFFPPSTHHLHLAFALSGILHPEKQPRRISCDDALETLKVNTLGPLLLMKWFVDLLPRKGTDLSNVRVEADEFRVPPHAAWLTNSARVGSTTDNRSGGWYSYRASKAGVNSITKSFDLHLRTRSAGNAVAMAYHPGTVKTGFSREFWGNVAEDKLFSLEFAVQKMLKVVANRSVGDGGGCWDWKDEEVPP